MLLKTSLRDAVIRLNVSHSTLSRILKDRSNIECATLEKGSDSRKRKRGNKEEVLEIVLKK